jgi:cellulose synthase/poly-beta-1,6-N-acetylglucosamine synthase-like glycosyltransferase
MYAEKVKDRTYQVYIDNYNVYVVNAKDEDEAIRKVKKKVKRKVKCVK